jgi:hypothetical protein
MKFDFDTWIAENYHIYEAFEREALKVARQRDRYSAKTIVEFLRHHTMITERGEEWKINNYATSGLARLFAKNHPTLKNLFEFRGTK